MTKYVQYGAGLCGPELWENFDSSPTLRAQRLPLFGALFRHAGPIFPTSVVYGDIVRGLPIPSNSCRAVYCSHVLEHLSLADFRKALSNTLDYLSPGGCFRFVLPDLEQFAEAYINNDSPDSALEFMKSTLLGRESRPRGPVGLLKSALGNSRHLWMWDYRSIRRELLEAGFHEVRRADFGDSNDQMFAAVENAERWDGSLGVNCYKPK